MSFRRLALFLVGFLFAFASPVSASASGNFAALLHDQSGEPVSDVVVALLQEPGKTLPILTRTNEAGGIYLKNIESGTYELVVKSPRYRSPQKKRIEVLPGKTTVATLVLQQLFQLESLGEENFSIKTLLRNGTDRRLIFRHLPEIAAEDGSFDGPFFEEAVFEVYTSAGLDGDYFVFPQDGIGGTTTNFAFNQSGLGNSNYILAGQLNSGEDSLWRIKNFVEYPLGDSHSLHMFVGYSRMSFDQPTLALLNNPLTLGDNKDYTRALGTTKILSLGFQESIVLGNAFSFLWGLELDQVHSNVRRTFVNPSAEVSFSPLPDTRIRLLMASKRSTHRSSVVLPDGEIVNLSDAVYFSRVGDQFNAGAFRYYQTSVGRKLDESTELELAAFRNQVFGAATPFMAVFHSQPDLQVLYLDDEQAENSGYRVTLRRQFNPSLKASVSYVQGNGTSIDRREATLVLDPSVLQTMVSRRNYHGVFTEVEAEIPSSGTRISALLKFVPDGNPLTTLDPLSDSYETGNEGINLFVRQIVPVPVEWLSFVGLDFLASYKIEALLDIRNLSNQHHGRIPTEVGDLVLVRNPRMVRGGIAVRF